MSNVLSSFRRQTPYFKTVFFITIAPVLIALGYMIYGVVDGLAAMRQNVPDAGLTIFFIPFIGLAAGAYVLLMYVCSRRSSVGRVVSVLVVVISLFEYGAVIAEQLSGANK